MFSSIELASIARARLRDAEVLASKGRYDGATYVCGYAVEVALKARIVKTLKWSGFPSEGGDFKELQSFKTHNLDVLVRLSGWERKIKSKFAPEWLSVSDWNLESRYGLPGNVTRHDAMRMIESATKLVEALL